MAHSQWRGYLANIWTFPFAQPKWGVLYGLFAGIILGLGTNFVFGIFKEEAITPWGMQQWAGLCFITSAMMLSLMALMLQFFNDHLVRKGKENAGFAEKCDQFNSGSWGGRRLTRASSFLFWLFLLAGVALLASAYWRVAPHLAGLPRGR